MYNDFLREARRPKVATTAQFPVTPADRQMHPPPAAFWSKQNFVRAIWGAGQDKTTSNVDSVIFAQILQRTYGASMRSWLSRGTSLGTAYCPDSKVGHDACLGFISLWCQESHNGHSVLGGTPGASALFPWRLPPLSHLKLFNFSETPGRDGKAIGQAGSTAM